MPIKNELKLFRSQHGKIIEHIRVSTLAGYWFCAAKSYLQALGVNSPSSPATEAGTELHNAFTAARPPSQLEIELENYLKRFMVNIDTGAGSTGLAGTEDKVFARAWKRDGQVVGWITSHGFDDFRVDPDKKVTIVEYKTTSQKVVDWYKLSTAIFQLKVYMWMIEPLLKQGGYTLHKAEIVYYPQLGKRDKRLPHEVEPLGVKTITDYSEASVEADIENIFKQFGEPTKMIPPARYKCYMCHPNFKSQCPFQGVPQS